MSTKPCTHNNCNHGLPNVDTFLNAHTHTHHGCSLGHSPCEYDFTSTDPHACNHGHSPCGYILTQ